MSKISIIGDVHFSLRKHKDFPEASSFEKNRFEQLIKHLCLNDSKYIVFAGDLLDKARPTLEEQEIIIEAFINLYENKKVVYVIAGNHEAITKTKSTYDFLYLPNYVEYITDGLVYFGDIVARLTSWHHLDKLYDVPREDKSDLLISHIRCNIGYAKEEFPIDELKNVAGVSILGDIHLPHSPAENVYYTNTPYSIHFSDIDTEFGYIVYDTNTGNINRVKLDLPQKYLLESCPVNLNELDKQHLYKIKVQGTYKDLEQYTNTDNIRFIKQIVTENVEVQDKETADIEHFFDTIIKKELGTSSDLYDGLKFGKDL